MSIQMRFFLIPVGDCANSVTELNRLLRSERILSIKKEFVADGPDSFWSLAVSYLSSDDGGGKGGDKGKVDYRSVLSPDEFALYVKLRDWRKKVAESEAVPVYAVLTNEQLAEISRRRVKTKKAFQEIPGVGDARVNKYADSLLALVSTHQESPGDLT